MCTHIIYTLQKYLIIFIRRTLFRISSQTFLQNINPSTVYFNFGARVTEKSILYKITRTVLLDYPILIYSPTELQSRENFKDRKKNHILETGYFEDSPKQSYFGVPNDQKCSQYALPALIPKSLIFTIILHLDGSSTANDIKFLFAGRSTTIGKS